MPASTPRIVEIPSDQVAYVNDLVWSGRYSSASAVLQALRQQDTATEDWLRQDVLQVMTAMLSDPSRGIPAQEVFDEIRALQSIR